MRVACLFTFLFAEDSFHGMGNAALWVFIIFVIILIILILLYIRWKHSKSELNYTKWVNDRVHTWFSGFCLATSTIFVNDRSVNRYIFETWNRNQYFVFSVLRAKYAVFDRVSQQLEC